MTSKEYSPSDIEKILKEEKKVILASGFTATQAEIDWAKDVLKNHPQKHEFAGIEDVISVKRSQDDYRNGRYIECF